MRARVRNIPGRLRAAFVVACILALDGCKLTSDAPHPSVLAILSGYGQTTAAGTPLANPLTVIVLNQFDGVVPDVTVTWAITAGEGSLSASSTTTGENGTAQVVYTAGPTAGTATVTATVQAIGTVTFVETIT